MTSLQGEKNPYLLQHVDNPVDWYAWAEPAFKRAQAFEETTRLAPFVAEMAMIDGRAAVYVCQQASCREPITSVDELVAFLDTMP